MLLFPQPSVGAKSWFAVIDRIRLPGKLARLVKKSIRSLGSPSISIVPGVWSAKRKLSRNGIMGSAELGFQGADKSQLAIAKYPACDRIPFA
jgi:hypothetical protein